MLQQNSATLGPANQQRVKKQWIAPNLIIINNCIVQSGVWPKGHEGQLTIGAEFPSYFHQYHS